MLFVANWIVPIVFWFYVIRLVRFGGRTLPALFAFIWLLGYFGFPQIGIEGGLYFISFEALLAVVLIFIDLYRHQMGKQTPKQNPLEETNE